MTKAIGAAGLIVLVALVFGVGTNSPIVPRWAVVYGGAAATLLAFTIHLFRNARCELSFSEVASFVFLVYLALSLSWSSDPRDGALTLEAMVVLWLIFVGVQRIPRRELIAGVYTGATIALFGSIVFGVAYKTTYGGVGNENYQSEMFLVLLPLVVAAWCAIKTPVAWLRWFALPVTLGAVWFLTTVNLSDTKWVAVAAILTAVAVMFVRRRNFYAVGLTCLIPINIALWSGWITSAVVIKAISHRVEIGFNSAILWSERPFFGHGLGSFNYEYGRVQEAHLRFFPDMDTVLHPSSVFAGAAHNELLQLGADSGLTGVLIALVIIGLLLRRFFVKNKDAADIGAAMSLVVVAALSQIGFPLQNPATVTIVVIAAAVLMQGDRVVLRLNTPKIPSTALCGALCAAILYSASLSWRAESIFKYVKPNIEIAHPIAFRSNLNAHLMYPYDRKYRHQLALTVGSLLKVAGGGVTITNEAADQSYRIAQSASRYMPAVQLSRLEYLLNSGRWEESSETEELLEWLKEHARLQPGVWLADGSYAVMTGDTERLLMALSMATKLPTKTHEAAFKHLASYLQTN